MPTEAQKQSLEYKNVEDKVAAALKTQAKLVPSKGANAATADYKVSLDYGVKSEIQEQFRPVPNIYMHGMWGWGHRGGSRIGIGFPIGGMWGGDYYEKVQVQINERKLNVNIRDGEKAVFQSTATSIGGETDLNLIMPYLVRSVFENFPGKDGSNTQLLFDSKTGELKEVRTIEPVSAAVAETPKVLPPTVPMIGAPQ